MPNGVLREVNDKSALDVSEAERQATFEARWEAGTGALFGLIQRHPHQQSLQRYDG